MKTNGIEMIFIGMIISTLSLTLIFYLGKRILDFLKAHDQPKLKPNAHNYNAASLESGNPRKKVETKPNIICSLPIHQESRPEAPLS